MANTRDYVQRVVENAMIYGAAKELFAHSTCAAKQLGSSLSPSVPFDLDAFQPD